MDRSYTYNPARIGEDGVDRMRFELGDTMVEGEEEACALTDQEIAAILGAYPGKWKRAKLALVESVWRRFSYEVDTKVGPLSLSLRQREEAWRRMYEELKDSTPSGVPTLGHTGMTGEPYFYAGMMDNPATTREKGANPHDVSKAR